MLQALTVLFTLEMLIKLVAYRLDYFRSGWNLLDFVVVVSGYVTLIVEGLAEEGAHRRAIPRKWKYKERGNEDKI